MPSYDQLDNEEAWRDEIAAPALSILASRIKAFYPGSGVWVRGDNAHMRGYHRSRRWIHTSIYCTDRNYSVSRTAGDRAGGDSNWACGVDIAVPQAELHAMCRRLDEACRAGRLEKVTEWFGNLGGDGTVDGWDNIANRPASADSSHLTHLHISLDRGRANEDHTDLFEILTGVRTVTARDRNEAYMVQNGLVGLEEPILHIPAEDGFAAISLTNPMATLLKALMTGTNANLPAFLNIPARTWVNSISLNFAQVKDAIAQLQLEPVNIDELVTQLVPALIPPLTAALRPMMQQVVEETLRSVLGSLDNE